MRIKLTKRAGKPHTLRCVRSDGSVTWSNQGDDFVRHDLIHYAVETTLALRKSFYGLLEDGWDIPSFALPSGQREREIPVEAVYTEFIVGLLQAETIGASRPADFQATLARDQRFRKA